MEGHFQFRHRLIATTVVVSAFAGAPIAGAGVSYTFDKDEWTAGLTSIATVDFTGFPMGTFITDQYADLGILFTDGNDSVFLNDVFINDGAGLDGNGNISVSFESPQFGIAVDFPGVILLRLFSEGEMIYESPGFGGSGEGFFVGLTSSEPFDAAVLIDFVGFDAEIDDLHFGVVPAPPTIAAISTLGFLPRRRRLTWRK